MIRPEQLRKKKLNTGGNIGEGAGAIAGNFIPGLPPGVGSMVGAKAGRFLGNLIGGKSKPKQPGVTTGTTMGYKYGGKYKRHLKYNVGGALPSAAQPIGNDAVRYEGPQHEQGGIPIDEAGNPTDEMNAVAEVEGNETRQGDYIFSDELMVPDSEMTFAQAHEMLLEQGAGEEQIEQLAQMQEQVKQQEGVGEQTMEQPPGSPMGEQGFANIPMAKGGKLPKYRYGVDQYNIRQQEKGIANMSTPSVTPETSVRSETSVKPKSTSPVNYSTGDKSSNINWLDTAQRFAPSVTRLASAAFAPKPKETPKMQARTISERNPAFAAGRATQASGFRANPTQAGHAQYTQGVNQLTASEAQDRTRREQFNAQSEMRADQMNIQSTARDNERLSQHQAAQIKLIDDAIQGPLNQMAADKRGKEQMKATLLTASAQIKDPADRTEFIQEVLALIEGGEPMERAIERAQMRYGGKITK